MKRVGFSVLSICMLVGFADLATAQDGQRNVSQTRGILVNVHGNGNYFNSNVENGKIGGLVGAKLGLSFKRGSIFLQSNNTYFKPKKLSLDYKSTGGLFIALGVGGRYHFETTNPSFIPYAEASFNVQYFTPPGRDEQNGFGYAGYGPAAGGGVQYFLSQTLALDIGLKLIYGYYNHTSTNTSGENVRVKSFNTQLSVGLTWYPLNWL